MQWTKYQSLGNDFLIAPLRTYESAVGKKNSIDRKQWVAPIVSLCHRKLGFGADGVILYESSGSENVECLLINSDGSEAFFSGNGFACLAKHFSQYNQVVINQRYQAFKQAISIKMLVSDFKPIHDKYLFDRSFHGFDYSLWDLGNEHAVFIKSPSEAELCKDRHCLDIFDKPEELELESHFDCIERYPDSINISFATLLGSQVKLRVRERGCGWTDACSSAAVATFLALRARNLVIDEVQVIQAGGECRLVWREIDQSVELILNPQCVGNLEYEIKR